MEIVAPFDGNTWRAVYTVRFRGFVYVLHAFQKKSKSGIATPKKDIDLIHQRLAAARRDHEGR
jgi:phage-related protein